MEEHKIVAIIDGNHLAFRAFCALNLATATGKGTSVIYGVLEMLNNFIEEYKPAGLIVCWDYGKSEYRKKVYEGYKASRVAKTEEEKNKKEDFILQCNVVKEILQSLGIPQIQRYGFEGDDMLYGVTCALKNTGVDCLIVTSDKDLLQLVKGKICWLDPIKKKFVNEANFTEQVGIPQEKFLLKKILMGDDGDDVPGVKGIGEVRAQRLAMKYDTLVGLSKNTGLTKEEQLVRGQLEILERNAKLVDISITMTEEVVGDIIRTLKESRVIDEAKFVEFLQTYEMQSLLNVKTELIERYELMRQKNETLANLIV